MILTINVMTKKSSYISYKLIYPFIKNNNYTIYKKYLEKNLGKYEKPNP